MPVHLTGIELFPSHILMLSEYFLHPQTPLKIIHCRKRRQKTSWSASRRKRHAFSSIATPWVNTGAINFSRPLHTETKIPFVRSQKIVWWPTKSGSTEDILRTRRRQGPGKVIPVFGLQVPQLEYGALIFISLLLMKVWEILLSKFLFRRFMLSTMLKLTKFNVIRSAHFQRIALHYLCFDFFNIYNISLCSLLWLQVASGQQVSSWFTNWQPEAVQLISQW